MANLTRRDFIKLLGISAVSSSGLFGDSRKAFGQQVAHVVVLGGGIGGCSFAKYLRIADPNVRITLIEQNRDYITCPRSNDVIVGTHTLDDITFNHSTIRNKYGVNVLIDKVTAVDTEKKQVRTASGEKLIYDRLVVSPGIDFRWDMIDGYNTKVAEKIPHAWKAGSQTLTLKQQLQAMPAGGTFIITPPANPFRCPPGPYERASLIAEWMQQHNPRGKILILDPKNRFTKDGPFTEGWKRLFGYGTDNSMIEWLPGDKGGRLLGVNARKMTVEIDAGKIKGDVINIIPGQKAGKLAFDMGLVDNSGWCPVNRTTFESLQVANVHVIGDACIADAMPKSGYAANTQAKVTAWAIADLLNDREPGTPSWSNTCYSLVASNYGISISATYELRDGKIHSVPNSGGLSPITDNPVQPLLESVYQKNWHRTFVKDVFS